MKNILITGASRGIGRAIAEKLYSEGNNLLLVASNIGSFENKLPDVHYYGADFSSFESIDLLSEQIAQQVTHVDVLINNIGMYIGKSFIDTNKQDLQRLMNVNFSGSAYFTHNLLPLLQKGSYSQLINISSIAVKNPQAGMAAYVASKAAVTGFSEALRAELTPQGIRVTILHLSGVNTWNDPHPELFLHPHDVANTIKFILDAEPHCQINEMTLSSVCITGRE